MRAKSKARSSSDAKVTIQLHLVGIIVFSAALVLASSLVAYGLFKFRADAGGESGFPKLYAATNANGSVDIELTNVPPWGQLSVRDIDLEQPEEYVAFEINTNRVETWAFEGMTPTLSGRPCNPPGWGRIRLKGRCQRVP